MTTQLGESLARLVPSTQWEAIVQAVTKGERINRHEIGTAIPGTQCVRSSGPEVWEV